MRLIATSDWHGALPDRLPDGDVLVIGGDTLPLDHRLEAQREHFSTVVVPYLAGLPYERILLIAGNHDFLFDSPLPWRDELPANLSYLSDEAVEIDGVRFYGSPWSVFLRGWVFMEREFQLERRWGQIPAGTDVLIVHGPPYRALDKTTPRMGGEHVGSTSLREWITAHEPWVVVCGHIHEAFGVDRIGPTTIYNVSYLDETYEHTTDREPVVIDLAR
jgi:Icc-related predicted phosphoesterase